MKKFISKYWVILLALLPFLIFLIVFVVSYIVYGPASEEETVNEYIKQVVGILGENIRVARFTRYVLGETE